MFIRPTEVGAHITVLMMDDAREHTTVTGGEVVVVVTITSDIMRNTLQRKTSTIITSHAEDRNTSRVE